MGINTHLLWWLPLSALYKCPRTNCMWNFPLWLCALKAEKLQIVSSLVFFLTHSSPLIPSVWVQGRGDYDIYRIYIWIFFLFIGQICNAPPHSYQNLFGWSVWSAQPFLCAHACWFCPFSAHHSSLEIHSGHKVNTPLMTQMHEHMSMSVCIVSCCCCCCYDIFSMCSCVRNHWLVYLFTTTWFTLWWAVNLE